MNTFFRSFCCLDSVHDHEKFSYPQSKNSLGKYFSLIYCSSSSGLIGIAKIVLKSQREKGNLDFSYWGIAFYKDD